MNIFCNGFFNIFCQALRRPLQTKKERAFALSFKNLVNCAV